MLPMKGGDLDGGDGLIVQDAVSCALASARHYILGQKTAFRKGKFAPRRNPLTQRPLALLYYDME